jgi:hypothetical protein
MWQFLHARRREGETRDTRAPVAQRAPSTIGRNPPISACWTPKLDDIERDKVWTSCVTVLPLREKGAAGSAVHPVAIGAPGR